MVEMASSPRAGDRRTRRLMKPSRGRQERLRRRGIGGRTAADVVFVELPGVKAGDVSPPARPPQMSPKVHAGYAVEIGVATLEQGADPARRPIVLEERSLRLDMNQVRVLSAEPLRQDGRMAAPAPIEALLHAF